MKKVLDRLKKKMISAIDGVKTIDGLVNLDLGKLLFGLSDNAESCLPVSVKGVKRRRIPRRINHKVTSAERVAIVTTLGKMDTEMAQYQLERDEICRHYMLTPKQVGAVVAGEKVRKNGAIGKKKFELKDVVRQEIRTKLWKSAPGTPTFSRGVNEILRRHSGISVQQIKASLWQMKQKHKK